MANTLNMFGDGDDLDVVEDVQRTFGIEISVAEAAATLNVGQLHDLIEAKSAASGQTGICYSQIAFHKLRRALRAQDPGLVVTPSSDVTIIRGWCSIRSKWKRLGAEAGLRLPPLEAPVAMPRRLAGADIILAQLFGDIPRRIRTIGDLAREASGHSFGALSGRSATSSPADRWQALLAILRGITNHKAPITRETTFFRA